EVMTRLNVGLIGLGRLGRVYARDLSSRIAPTRLAAVADADRALAKELAAQFDVPHAYDEAAQLIGDPGVDAIVIVSPTHTHCDIVKAALAAKKPTFCEKPPAISLTDAAEMMAAAEQTGTFLQIVFVRRFDPGYAAARRQIEDGRIGRPVVFKATSRDPY